MRFWLVVFIMIEGSWVSGEELDGWGPVPYESEAECLRSKARAEELQAELRSQNPRAHPKRFVCEARP